ncbi:MAG: MarR family transcriptional regulator [Sphingomonadaceae bacterium]|nr:MarR family transcriptional regulator [Sphingomonadaceae bacterium]NCA01415.1 MarR family transcriptional regulator [Sphingomonadaceae bacterium]
MDFISAVPRLDITKKDEVGKAMGPLTEGLTRVEQQFHLRAITPEFEILMHLYEKGPTPSAALRAASRASSAAFSLVLKRLVGSNLLQVAHGCSDRRVRKYDLTPWARGVMDEFARTTVRVLTKEPAAGD